jgi:TonB family protein
MIRTAILILSGLSLAACTAVSSLPGAGGMDPRSEPFHAQQPFPVPANVERLIGPEDCQGAQLAAREFELPEYPPRAWSRGLQGWVIVRFHVYDTGQPHRVRAAESVPDGYFDGAAERAVQRWRFQELPDDQALSNCVVLFEFRNGNVRIR